VYAGFAKVRDDLGGTYPNVDVSDDVLVSLFLILIALVALTALVALVGREVAGGSGSARPRPPAA
jgi:hypothetical protein